MWWTTTFPSSSRYITCLHPKDSRFGRLTKQKIFWLTPALTMSVTGLEVLARLCAISPKTRVIVITAREDLAARATAMAIGPVAFFMKPFDDEKFITAVRDALSQREK